MTDLENVDRPTRKPRKTSSTRKVEVGRETLLDQQTGELVDIPAIVIRGGDVNFDKIWVWHLCDAYKLVGNKAIDVINYMIEVRNRDNLIIGSQRKLAEDIGVSVPTLARVIKILKKHKIVTMPQQGVYRLSPDMIWKGDHQKRMQVLFDYKNEAKEEVPLSKEQECERLRKKHRSASEELKNLEKQINLLEEEERLLEDAAAE